MPISVFLSRPSPHEQRQRDFLKQGGRYLAGRGLAPRTIGDTDYGVQPMPHIRSVMMDCNGLLGIALRRFHVVKGVDRPNADQAFTTRGDVEDEWMTTPYLHLEAAIAFQLGLPILLFVEEGVSRRVRSSPACSSCTHPRSISGPRGPAARS